MEGVKSSNGHELLKENIKLILFLVKIFSWFVLEEVVGK